jgi:hypothetical protein
MRENNYQAKLIKKIRLLIPGCIIQKNDSSYIQGYPDITIYFGRRWGALEIKTSVNAPHQPNQEYWIDYLNQMSYASFISPETEDGVLHELQQALGACGKTRVP